MENWEREYRDQLESELADEKYKFRLEGFYIITGKDGYIEYLVGQRRIHRRRNWIIEVPNRFTQGTPTYRDLSNFMLEPGVATYKEFKI